MIKSTNYIFLIKREPSTTKINNRVKHRDAYIFKKHADSDYSNQRLFFLPFFLSAPNAFIDMSPFIRPLPPSEYRPLGAPDTPILFEEDEAAAATNPAGGMLQPIGISDPWLKGTIPPTAGNEREIALWRSGFWRRAVGPRIEL